MHERHTRVYNALAFGSGALPPLQLPQRPEPFPVPGVEGWQGRAKATPQAWIVKCRAECLKGRKSWKLIKRFCICFSSWAEASLAMDLERNKPEIHAFSASKLVRSHSLYPICLLLPTGIFRFHKDVNISDLKELSLDV